MTKLLWPCVTVYVLLCKSCCDWSLSSKASSHWLRQNWFLPACTFLPAWTEVTAWRSRVFYTTFSLEWDTEYDRAIIWPSCYWSDRASAIGLLFVRRVLIGYWGTVCISTVIMVKLWQLGLDRALYYTGPRRKNRTETRGDNKDCLTLILCTWSWPSDDSFNAVYDFEQGWVEACVCLIPLLWGSPITLHTCGVRSPLWPEAEWGRDPQLLPRYTWNCRIGEPLQDRVHQLQDRGVLQGH